MKKLLILLMMIYLLPAKADILLDIMNGMYEEPLSISDKTEDYEEDHGIDNGEAYHWDDLYLCTYCYNTEVIIDPYGSEDEIRFSY